MQMFKITVLLLVAVLCISLVGFNVKVKADKSPFRDPENVIAVYDYTDLSVVPGEPLGTEPLAIPFYHEPWIEEYYALYQVNALVALDEEWCEKTYWIPWVGGVSPEDGAINIVERADDPFVDTFCSTWKTDDYGSPYPADSWNIKMWGVLYWTSTDNIECGDDWLREMTDETGFYVGKTYVFDGESVQIDLLCGFTGENLLRFNMAGFCLKDHPGVCLMMSRGYCFDDNLAQHEISHAITWKLPIPSDTYVSDHNVSGLNCVMNAYPVYVEFWWEDNCPFYVGYEVPYAYTTENWCSECLSMLWLQRFRYKVVHLPRAGGNFPLGVGST